MQTGYSLDPDRHIYGPTGRTPWWVRRVGDRDVIEGRQGVTGFEIHGDRVVTPRGGDTGYYLAPAGRRREFHGPDDVLPWMPRPAGLRPPRSQTQ